MNPVQVKFKLIRPGARKPTIGYRGDAAFDLYPIPHPNRVGILAKEENYVISVHTGVAVEIPEGYYGQIEGRSSYAKQGLAILGGIIDSGYRGEVVIFCTSLGAETFFDRTKAIAQMVIHPIPQVELIEVSELTPSERGENGFGSTNTTTPDATSSQPVSDQPSE